MPAPGFFSDDTVKEVLPGVQLYRHPRSRFVFVRLWNKDTQAYVRRSTGKLDHTEARGWVLENLQELFAAKPTERGGGANSTVRLISNHLEYQNQRFKAGEISEGTLIHYDKSARHWIKWLTVHKLKKLSDIKRTTLKTYARDRVNNDGMSMNSANAEVTFFRMFWTWLNDTEVITRPLSIDKLKAAVGEKVKNEPFHPGDLNRIKKEIQLFVKGKDKAGMFNNQKSEYNKLVFQRYIDVLDQGGFRQHEIHKRKWSDVKIGETLSDRKRIINTIIVPQRTKRGYRQHVFRGDALIELKRIQKKMCPNVSESDYIFRNEQTNTPIDASTFSRYWTSIRQKLGLTYTLHTFRSHRITQLILSGVDSVLVARNLGLSPAQINKSYLRFVPAGHWSELVQPDSKEDKELKSLMGDNDDV